MPECSIRPRKTQKAGRLQVLKTRTAGIKTDCSDRDGCFFRWQKREGQGLLVKSWQFQAYEKISR
jgi:hypothetical protein